MYNDPIVVIVIILAVMAGGLIKGTIGFGMPMVALRLLSPLEIQYLVQEQQWL